MSAEKIIFLVQGMCDNLLPGMFFYVEVRLKEHEPNTPFMCVSVFVRVIHTGLSEPHPNLTPLDDHQSSLCSCKFIMSETNGTNHFEIDSKLSESIMV